MTGKIVSQLLLEISGLMRDKPLKEVNELLENAKEVVFRMGVNPGVDPFMTRSFMALTVIPTLRQTIRGVWM